MIAMKSVQGDTFEFETVPDEAEGSHFSPLRSRSHNGVEAMGEARTFGRMKSSDLSPNDLIARDDTVSFDPHSFNLKFGGVCVAKYKINRTVYAQGTAADSIFYIQHGKVKLMGAAKNGKQAVLAILGSGQFCGTGCLSGQRRHILSATAATECSIARLKTSAVNQAIDQDPSFAWLIISHLSKRETRLQDDLADHLCNSSEQRLARMLLLMADYGRSGWGNPLSPKIDQATLGNMVGATRQRVNFFLKKFRLAGHIAYGEDIRVNASLQHVARV
jgi:CRP/FNR family cyclic AMP-dependent transcriptional regulator